MAIHSHGFAPLAKDSEHERREFWDSLDLLLAHEPTVISSAEYFFCPLAFAFCSWPYVAGDGPLYLGYLLLGWRDGLLTEACLYCGGTALLHYFGGSLGGNSWSGYCRECATAVKGRDSGKFWDRISFVANLRKQRPFEVREWQEYSGNVFSWGGTGLAQGNKKQLIVRQVVEPLTFSDILAEWRID